MQPHSSLMKHMVPFYGWGHSESEPWVISPRSHSYQVADLGSEPRLYISSTQVKYPLASIPSCKVTGHKSDSLPWAPLEKPCFYCLSEQWEQKKRASLSQCSQRLVSRPATSAFPGNLLEMQVLEPHSRPLESETLGWRQLTVFHRPCRGFW